MHFRPTLITKLACAITLILLGFMGLLDYTNIHNFRKAMIEYAVSNADQMAEVINQSAYDSMLKNDKNSLFEMIRRIGQSEGVMHIRLMDRTGRIFYSSTREEIGTVINKNTEACTMCHKSENPRLYATSMHRSRFFTAADGTDVMGFTKAIYNEPACYTAACHVHPQSYSILGVLDIVVSLNNLHQKVHDYRTQFIILTCIFVAATGILITLLTQLFVNKPVQRLVRHMSRVSAGDLEARVPVISRDELGELSEEVNRMTANLARARSELEEWGSSLEVKVDERTREIKRIENQLYRSEKLASLGKLVAGIAHEINNPLTGVLLYSSIVSSDKRLEPELKADIDRVIVESRRCADIVSRLLEFSREAMPHKEAIGLNGMLDKIVSLIEKQPSFHDIEIVRHYAADLPDILVDPGQIQQVFINLFVNASQAMASGGVLTISTFFETEQGRVCAEIRDNGCGISEEELGQIFDPFFTTKADGTGLGLSISYGIVENNGGSIAVRSTPGSGTVFTVRLPIYQGTLVDEFNE